MILGECVRPLLIVLTAAFSGPNALATPSVLRNPLMLQNVRIPRTCNHVRRLPAYTVRLGDCLSCSLCERSFDKRPYQEKRSSQWNIPINTILPYRCTQCKRSLCFHCWTHHSPVCGSELGPFGIVLNEYGTFWGKHEGSQACCDANYRYRAITHPEKWKCYRCLATIDKSRRALCGACKRIYCSACSVIHKSNNECTNDSLASHPGGHRATVIVDRYPWKASYYADEAIPLGWSPCPLIALQRPPPKPIIKGTGIMWEGCWSQWAQDIDWQAFEHSLHN